MKDLHILNQTARGDFRLGGIIKESIQYKKDIKPAINEYAQQYALGRGVEVVYQSSYKITKLKTSFCGESVFRLTLDTENGEVVKFFAQV